MNLYPTPFTAALAGAFSAVALPAANRWLAGDSDTSTNFVLAFLLLVALPAHAGVLGLRRPDGAHSRSIDKPLLVRIGAWLGSACLVSAASLALAWPGEPAERKVSVAREALHATRASATEPVTPQ